MLPVQVQFYLLLTAEPAPNTGLVRIAKRDFNHRCACFIPPRQKHLHTVHLLFVKTNSVFAIVVWRRKARHAIVLSPGLDKHVSCELLCYK